MSLRLADLTQEEREFYPAADWGAVLLLKNTQPESWSAAEQAAVEGLIRRHPGLLSISSVASTVSAASPRASGVADWLHSGSLVTAEDARGPSSSRRAGGLMPASGRDPEEPRLPAAVTMTDTPFPSPLPSTPRRVPQSWLRERYEALMPQWEMYQRSQSVQTQYLPHQSPPDQPMSQHPPPQQQHDYRGAPAALRGTAPNNDAQLTARIGELEARHVAARAEWRRAVDEAAAAQAVMRQAEMEVLALVAERTGCSVGNESPSSQSQAVAVASSLWPSGFGVAGKKGPGKFFSGANPKTAAIY